ncbi:hypothetical protein [Nocardiopsis alba]|uniref:Fibronectin type-III domain-containing protein n=1 Tax=Nocardiopsis alba TaxID=53437 RepID=A0A7K2IL78_9ACTN|nr:hypothetical protein [Nocardiopsis alba]MYR30729.1 hypothetical protein [Nocardiopsis alba]
MTTPAERELKAAVARLEKLFREQQREIRTLKAARRAPQLGASSIDSGALEVRDPESGSTRLRIGRQPDGTIGVVAEGGDPAPSPSDPVVAPAPVGLMVSWDGTLADPELTLPADLDHVSVHVSEQTGFTPSAVTFVGTIPRSGGVLPVVPLEVGTTYYVLLVPVGIGGVEGAPSVEASGIPEAVGGVPGPGSITETEIADDAISTPKLQALAVNAAKIAANAIEAGHITAGAVEASKLAAQIVLSTRIIAGDPAAARVEIDQHGLRGYSISNELVFAIDDNGNAVFSGNIVGSEISGSRFTMGTGSVTGAIEASGGVVAQRVLSGVRQAQLIATGNTAEFSARQDGTNPSSPIAAMYTMETQVGLTIDSSRLAADQLPSITAVAFPHSAQMVLWAERNNPEAPYSGLTTTPNEVAGLWSAGDGSEVRLRASRASASILLTPPAPSAPSPNGVETPGYVFANRGSDDTSGVSLQSPRWEEPGNAAHLRRSVIFAEGGRPARPFTRIVQAARRVLVMGEAAGGGYDATSDGCLELATTHSIQAPRHAPVRTDMITAPSSGPTGTWTAFSSSAYPAIDFQTGWSGRARITITAGAGNTTTNTSTIHFGFGLTGASTIGPAVARAWSARGVLMQCCSRVVYLDLEPNAAYTLTPYWNYSSGTIGGTVTFYTTYEHSIVVEPLM